MPPSDAAATARDDGTVLVTWTPGTRPNAYRILRTDRGREVASTPADAGSATVTTVPPGETVAFVVEAVFDTGVARSEPSNSVTVFTWPDAPGGVDVSYVGDDGNEIAVRVAWSEPSDNGSPITHYVVDINADSGDRQVRTVTELRSGPMTLRCATPRCDGIRLEVRVNATNAAGDGPNGRAGYTHNAGPPPPPPVRDGDDVITGHSVDDLTVTVTFSGAWSSHPHQCAVLARGPIGVSDYISCDASSATLTLWRYGSYEFFMMALDPDSGRWIESAPEPVEVRMPRPPPPPPPCDPEPCAPLTGATESIVVGAATGFAGVVLLTRARYSRRTRQR